MALPQHIINGVDSRYNLDGAKVKVIRGIKLFLGKYFVFPTHEHDLKEYNVSCVWKENVSLTHSTVFLSGGKTEIYEKQDEAKPSYLVFCFNHNSEEIFAYYEF